MAITVPDRPGLHVERLPNGGLAIVFVEILSAADAQLLTDLINRVMSSPPPNSGANNP
jgi:hypothetical protein